MGGSSRCIHMTSQPCVMVVDDQPANLSLLEDILGEHYRVRSFPRGRLALAAAAAEPPDLILLDINMPEMKGFEVCEKLKATPELADIPVIFLSALGETEDKVKAFRAGAVDYITKPFQLEEVHARVSTHVELHRTRQELRQSNDYLEELVLERTRELAEAHRRLKTLDSAKSDFLRLISHELRTPLNGIVGVAELALGANGDGGELREMFDQSRRRMMTILDYSLLLTQIEVEGERFAPRPVSLTKVFEGAAQRIAAEVGAKRVAIETMPDGDIRVLGQEELLVEAFRALLDAALKLTAPGETVRLTGFALPEAVHVNIYSRGYAIPERVLPRFFDLLAIAEAIAPGGCDLGLGPPTAARIFSLFGGRVRVENSATQGTRMEVLLRQAVQS